MRTISQLLNAAPLAALFLFASCSGRSLDRVTPPPSPPLSRSIGYAVILSSYVQVRDTPAEGGVSLGYYRRGAIASVVERRAVEIEEQVVFWIKLDGDERGWIKESEAHVYNNAAKAHTAAEELTR